MTRLRRNLLLILVFVSLLGATAFREEVAAAAKDALLVVVTNDPSQPVPVREQQRVTPVQKSTFGSFPSGEAFSSTVTLFTVPAGKVLVIESVSAGSNMQPNDRLMAAEFFVTYEDFLDFVISLHPADEGVFAPTNVRVFKGTEVTSAYAGPGTTITARGVRDGTVVAGTAVRLAISGRLIDAP